MPGGRGPQVLVERGKSEKASQRRCCLCCQEDELSFKSYIMPVLGHPHIAIMKYLRMGNL